MITKKVVSIKDSKKFFDLDINRFPNSIGKCIVDFQKRELNFDLFALEILAEIKLFEDEYYPFENEYLNTKLIELFTKIYQQEEILETSHFTFSNQSCDIQIKVEQHNEFIYYFYLFSVDTLLKTEQQMTLLNSVLETGNSIYTVCTWWIDYDKFSDHFFQTDSGPKMLGIPVNKDMFYNTNEFATVREKAALKTPYYDECIKAERDMYEKVKSNKTNYFGGRTPAISIDDREVWVESYGICLLRYPDGRPRLFAAVDIYLSDLLENSNQATLLHSLVDKGLMDSKIGYWYYQKYHNEGKYYFTESHKKLMKVSGVLNTSNITEKLIKHNNEIIKHTPEYKGYLNNFRETHAKIFTGELEYYNCVVPNNIDPEIPQWIEIRGNVIERNEDGTVRLFIAVNVDVTDTIMRNIELEALKLENEHLVLAEKLAIKSGNVLVWYQDLNLLKDNNYVFGNDLFVQKLGVKRNSDGYILLKALHKSIVKNDKVSRMQARDFMQGLKNVFTNKENSMKKMLVKHINLNTKEEMYFEHTVEIEEKFPNGEIKLVGGFLRDVTEEIYKQERITFLANNDILTGLKNRNYFENYILSSEFPTSYSVTLFDLDGLKLVNDAFGHYEGDNVIVMLANLLKKVYKDNLLIARIGGDEFIVLTKDVIVSELVEKYSVLEKLIVEYNMDSAIEINVSKGGFTVNNNDISFEKAFMYAENLMYRRKLNNRASRKSKVLESIMETLNAKTEETKEHSDRIVELSIKLMKELGFTRLVEQEDLALLARVHDVGKITIPDYILSKPGKVTEEEYDIIKKHSEAGYKIIKNITDSDVVSEGVLSHHERYDGKGYPQGLKGNDIPVFARIISVVDSFDAMTSERVYNKTKTVKEALEELRKCSGTQFDPRIVAAFIKMFEI